MLHYTYVTLHICYTTHIMTYVTLHTLMLHYTYHDICYTTHMLHYTFSCYTTHMLHYTFSCYTTHSHVTQHILMLHYTCSCYTNHSRIVLVTIGFCGDYLSRWRLEIVQTYVLKKVLSARDFWEFIFRYEMKMHNFN